MPKYVPTEMEGFGAKVEGKGVFEGSSTIINIIDTSGSKELKPIRMLAAGDADCAILCFSLDDDMSLERACDFWLQEVRDVVPGCPIILCGTKQDQREISIAKG